MYDKNARLAKSLGIVLIIFVVGMSLVTPYMHWLLTHPH